MSTDFALRAALMLLAAAGAAAGVGVLARAADAPARTPATSASLSALQNSLKTADPDWSASHTEIQQNHVVLEDFDLVQGDLHLTSDHAEAAGIDFNNSTWTFTGKVDITLPQGELTSDMATVHFVAGKVQLATATGAPAHFNATLAGSGATPVRNTSGRAQSIEYDVLHQQLRFQGEAWFSDGGNELNAPKVTYDLSTRGYSADAPAGQRVHGTIKQKSTTP
jgi:lipopolysaccharide transport protein LptA